jgi:hypothetical protein
MSLEEAFVEPWLSLLVLAKIEVTSLSAILKDNAKMIMEETKTIPISNIGVSLKRHLIA